MKAMIFAAGLGTRLYPLTTERPKALVEVAGKSLLQMAIEKISASGYNELVINIHHFGSQIIGFLEQNNYFNLTIKISDERGQLLDTGGGVLHAAPWLDGDGPFLVYNVDVLSNINLLQFREYHVERGGLATLAVRDRKSERYLAFDESMRLSGWKNIKTGEDRFPRNISNCSFLAFSGIQLIEPAIFRLIPLYLRLAADHRIYGYHDPSSLWMDLGKPDQIKEAEKLLKKQ
jgi:NDP-sugar pyrophosphorylase family protein